MDTLLKTKLIEIAKKRISKDDVSHDFQHTYRVLLNAERIAKIEGGDLDIIIPAALFHDIIVYPKNSELDKKFKSQEDSAKEAKKILNSIEEYPKYKIDKVARAIKDCSFSRGILPEFIESKILQDADKLESTGLISIMRTYSSAGQMKKPFYNPKDPFCIKRKPDNEKYALDLFYTRLLLAKERMHTQTAKKMAIKKHEALINFLKGLKEELG